MDIGSKIRRARLAKGMTQETLGELLGVQKSAIAKYENGRVVNIKRSTLKKISDILDIPASELIFEKTRKSQELFDKTQEILNKFTEEELELFLKLKDLPIDEYEKAMIKVMGIVDDAK